MVDINKTLVTPVGWKDNQNIDRETEVPTTSVDGEDFGELIQRHQNEVQEFYDRTH
jgi:hypothetical protein